MELAKDQLDLDHLEPQHEHQHVSHPFTLVSGGKPESHLHVPSPLKDGQLLLIRCP